MTQHAWEEFSNRRVDRHELVRRHNQELVLSTFLTGGEYTRVQVADMTSLSKPTVNAIVEDLLHSGLVEKVGSRVGVAGRSAAVYRPDPRGGSVVAIDIGARKIRGAVANLVGEIVFERTVDTPRRGRLVDEASSLIADLASNSGAYPNSPSLAVVGSPGVVDPMTGLLSHALNTPELIGLPLGQRLQERTGMPVLVENDVNLATVGEYHHGRAQGLENFAFLWVGNGLGLGAVVGGELLRGSRGAAGEIGFLALGDKAAGEPNKRGALEAKAGAAGIQASARRMRAAFPATALGQRPSVEQIFAAAEQRDPLGLAVIDQEARLLARAAIAVCAILDPALVVLGGGVGANELLLDPVQRHMRSLSPLQVNICASHLRERAALLGAISVGLADLHRRVVSDGILATG